jgi:hypothetical protein
MAGRRLCGLGQGVARVNIDDDEVYPKPTVSVSTSGSADNRATESGDDHGYLRVYRTGNVSSNINCLLDVAAARLQASGPTN